MGRSQQCTILWKFRIAESLPKCSEYPIIEFELKMMNIERKMWTLASSPKTTCDSMKTFSQTVQNKVIAFFAVPMKPRSHAAFITHSLFQIIYVHINIATETVWSANQLWAKQNQSWKILTSEWIKYTNSKMPFHVGSACHTYIEERCGRWYAVGTGHPIGNYTRSHARQNHHVHRSNCVSSSWSCNFPN